MGIRDNQTSRPDPAHLLPELRDWARELGFQDLGISSLDLETDERRFLRWLTLGRHGGMGYMARHGTRRSRPADLVPGTNSVICLRMDYFPPAGAPAETVLDADGLGYVSRYALGRDYHKLMRRRLQRLAERLESRIGPFGYRVFVDSAPVLEKPLARNAGIGWVGKHTNVLNRAAGSWFFLGEIYTDLALPASETATDHCGRCRACMDLCPTGAIVAPYELDARLCISYLTIEHRGPIPVPLRTSMGNRIYGCDDCQLVCPWNRFSVPTPETDFLPRNGLDAPRLTDLFAWDRRTFERRTEGSPIRRIGHALWLRNIAVALGNSAPAPSVVEALKKRGGHPEELVREHVEWALRRQTDDNRP